MKIACFTVAAMDYFPQQNAYFAGGNALNQAVRFAEKGFESTFLGALGSDAHGDKIHSLLKKRGVDVSQLQVIPGLTAHNRLINDDVGERFGEDGAWHGGVFESYTLAEQNWAYIADFELWVTHASCPDFGEALARKSKKNFLCADYLHLPDINVLEKTIEQVDIAFVGGDSSMIPALQPLSTKCSTLIVLTLGAGGSIAFLDGQQTAVKADTSEKVLDTTGCGDAFQSAFASCYYQTRDAAQALEAGTELGTLATKSYGGVSW